MEEPSVWVFDTGPLSHFAKAGWLGLLRAVTGDRLAVIPDVVHRELTEGLDAHPHLSGVLDADWISVRPVTSIDELTAFAKYSARLVRGGSTRNLGECGVLALAEGPNRVAILDDRAARQAAKEHGVDHRGTVALLVDAMRDHGLSIDLAQTVADDLLATEYRLPFGPGDFKRWVTENGLIEPEH